jgi:hypothetical protein
LTTTEAEACTVPTVAVIVPVPGAEAVNLVGLPCVGENVPRAGVTDHDGETDTAFPY